MTITFILLCIGANLFFFLLRRFETREKSCQNYAPDYGVSPKLLSIVPSIIVKYGKKANGKLPYSLPLPCSIRLFFSEYECLCLDGDGAVLSRKFIEVPYRGNDDFVQIGTLSYGEDVVLVRKSEKDANIYIVGCEDDDPAHPELYATSLENFIAMCIGQYVDESKMSGSTQMKTDFDRQLYVFSHNGAYVPTNVKTITLQASNGVIPPQKRNRETYGYKP